MKKIVASIILLGLCNSAFAADFTREYGVQTTINFELYETDGTDLKSDAAHASGDTKLMKDNGDEANTTNGFTDEGQGYSIVLTATEMQAARIVLYVVDQSTKVWLDRVLVVETFGNASSQYPDEGVTCSTVEDKAGYTVTFADGVSTAQ